MLLTVHQKYEKLDVKMNFHYLPCAASLPTVKKISFLKIPLSPPFPKGEVICLLCKNRGEVFCPPPFEKGGVGGI
jgi:hypothetical protein